MCKTRFDSQGMIQNGFKKNIFEKNVNGTRDLPPFMTNTIKISLFFNPSL